MEEFESGGKPMEGVSTSTAGFVGLAERGPVGGVPVLVTNFADFKRKFGGYLSAAEFGSYRFLSYTPNSLSRRLNHLTARLEREKGILYFKSRRSEERSITLIRRENDDNDDKNSAEGIPSLPSSLTESILE